MDMGSIAIEDRGEPVISSYAGNASCTHQDVAATATVCAPFLWNCPRTTHKHTNTNTNTNINKNTNRHTPGC